MMHDVGRFSEDTLLIGPHYNEMEWNHIWFNGPDLIWSHLIGSWVPHAHEEYSTVLKHIRMQHLEQFGSSTTATGASTHWLQGAESLVFPS